jgi:hypothetical protein
MPPSPTHLEWISERLYAEGFDITITSNFVDGFDYLTVVTGPVQISRFIPNEMTRRERVFLFWEMSNTIRMRERKYK